MASEQMPRTLTITVAGGTGTITFPNDYAGRCIGFAVKPPTQSSTYDFELFDSESYGQEGAVGCIGYSSHKGRYQIHAGGSFDLTNCNFSGDATLRIWYDE